MVKDERGQTLIIIIFLMILALSIGIIVSERLVGGLRRSTSLDSSSRAQSVAEALAERVLVFPNSTLDGYITNNNCGANCTLSITGTDNLVSSAQATLAYAGNSTSSFNVKVNKNETYEVTLDGYSATASIYICWDDATSGANPSVIASRISGTTSYSVTKYAYNSASTVYAPNGFSTASSYLTYPNCFNLPAQANSRMLRIRALYNDLNLYVIPQSGNSLPIQGYLITSVGTVGNIKKTVKVIKSKSFAPAVLDFTIFSTSQTVPLEN